MSVVGGIPYEQRLANEKGWALDEGHRFFQEQSAAHNALRRIAKRLNDIGVEYAVVGGMALFHHGFRRFTEDVDILVTRDSLKRIHAHLDGLGYVRPFSQSKNLRDAELGVKIEFLISGDFPGDGKPKPVSFPDPAQVYEDFEGIRFINLATFVELKLASGMTNPLRGKDLVDVQELIQALDLAAEFGEKLNSFVRPKYREIWSLLHAASQRYVRSWNYDTQTAVGDSVDELRTAFANTSPEFKEMLAYGVEIMKADQGIVMLATTDADVAARFDFIAEEEYWNENDASDDAS